MRKITSQTVVGIVFWLISITFSIWLVRNLSQNESFYQGVQRLSNYWTARNEIRSAKLTFPMDYEFRDPVFLVNAKGEYERIGEINSPSAELLETGSTVDIRLYTKPAAEWSGGHLELHEPPADMARVAEVLFTPDRNSRLLELWKSAKNRHEKEVAQILEPIFQDCLKKLNPIIQKELKSSIDSHQATIQKIAEKYRKQIVQDKLIPLIKTEVFPVVKQESNPLAEEIGEKLWKKVSLGSFAWRAVYDGIVSPDHSLVAAEWNRFLNDDAFPILESHTDDFVRVQGNILKRLAKNPRVRRVLIESIKTIGNDPEFRKLIGNIVRNTLTENERVKSKIREILTAESTQSAFRKVGDRVEPETTKFGQEVFGTPEKITKEFALVLRQMVLRKDKRWLVWVPDSTKTHSPGDPIPIIRAKKISIPPFYFPPK